MTYSHEQFEFLYQGWRALAAHSEAFQTSRSDQIDFVDLVTELEGTESKVYTRLNWKYFYNVDHYWEFFYGGSAYIIQKEKNVWLNIQDFAQGHGGSIVYNFTSNYAYNNNLVFIGDPDGLSETALTRRLENMISSSLKFQTTKHLAPHRNQLIGNSEVPGLIWTAGDDFSNIISMLLASYAYIIYTVPDIKFIRYNFSEDKFEDIRNGREINEIELTEIIIAARARETSHLQNGERITTTTTAGSTTLKRAIFSSSLLCAEGSKRLEILGALGRFEDQLCLRHLLY